MDHQQGEVKLVSICPYNSLEVHMTITRYALRIPGQLFDIVKEAHLHSLIYCPEYQAEKYHAYETIRI